MLTGKSLIIPNCTCTGLAVIQSPEHHGSHAIDMRNKIMIMNDDKDLCELLVSYLAREGFDAETTHDGTGDELSDQGRDFNLMAVRIGRDAQALESFTDFYKS